MCEFRGFNGRMCCYFYSRWWSARKCTVATGSCYFHRRDSSICNTSFHKFFVLENSPVEKNSRSWRPALVFSGKEVWCKGMLMAKRMSRIVIAVSGWLVMRTSYGRLIIRTVDHTDGWSYGRLTYIVSDTVYRFHTRLQFMAAVWREEEANHTTLLALLYCLYRLIQILVF